jgi:hypothetical protein
MKENTEISVVEGHQIEVGLLNWAQIKNVQTITDDKNSFHCLDLNFLLEVRGSA